MSLSAGLNIARSALAAVSGQTAVISRNISALNDPHYARRTANVASLVSGGGVEISSITRSTDKVLFTTKLDAASRAMMHEEIAASLDALENTINDPNLGRSPSALIGKFNDALQLYANAPHDVTAASSAVAAAANLANALNDATSTVQGVRAQADADMASSVDRINSLLSRLEDVNAIIVSQSETAGDLNDYLDQREKIISELSEEIGIKTVSRGRNDLVVYTDGGVTLFESRARAVTFQSTGAFTAGIEGNAVYVDGVPVTGDTAGMKTHSGRLAGYAAVRDTLAPAYQSQLDEVARGLIVAFRESDQSAAPALPDVPGLFTWSGAPATPGGAIVPGIAGSIKVNANVNPAVGGNVNLLRDGGISNPANPAYVYNDSGAAGFSDRLRELLDIMSTPQGFDTQAGLGTNVTLVKFAGASAGWLEEARRSATSDADYSATLLNRAGSALSNVTGVNLDEEMTIMLELERSYQASAKLVSTIDSMFDTLLAAV
ncbi:flagellar hook-associated protein FlgK [Nordella sp. HKS 07]|uniref:flagellar hook-associated protein FlgK n=1 Tax=Nordella sp. HKS 07 TaxID=2712222 RepID=UPI0013E10301|nr:flagellar hook-associated protein FlgK [Nordella sp. HKS 07]QIG49902.1 flagellar hook-associated protein FlgK [Nordella sp. HKS 07]